jgi:hypothetical protein
MCVPEEFLFPSVANRDHQHTGELAVGGQTLLSLSLLLVDASDIINGWLVALFR